VKSDHEFVIALCLRPGIRRFVALRMTLRDPDPEPLEVWGCATFLDARGPRHEPTFYFSGALCEWRAAVAVETGLAADALSGVVRVR